MFLMSAYQHKPSPHQFVLIIFIKKLIALSGIRGAAHPNRVKEFNNCAAEACPVTFTDVAFYC
jgi:hypothetical protein